MPQCSVPVHSGKLIWICEEIYFDVNTIFDNEYEHLIGLIDDLGFEVKAFEEKEQVLSVEKNAFVSAAAVIVESDSAYEIADYNHHLLKGNIAEKQKIQKILADKFEPTRNELRKINSTLVSSKAILMDYVSLLHLKNASTLSN